MQHIGKQVILVDAHLLAPTQPQRFGLKTEPGLAEVLDKQLPLADVIQKTPASEIHFLAAGQNTATTIDLLASPAMAALLCQLKSQYDIIIMDTPAVVSSSDAIALGTLADQIVLVMKPHSVRQTAEKAQRELVNVCNKLVGVVINPT
jgi:Mrp family chromosome partitioning ATPase